MNVLSLQRGDQPTQKMHPTVLIQRIAKCQISKDILLSCWELYERQFNSGHYALLWKRLAASVLQKQDRQIPFEPADGETIFRLLAATKAHLRNCDSRNLASLLASFSDLNMCNKELWDEASFVLCSKDGRNNFSSFDARSLVRLLGIWIISRMDPTDVLEGVAQEVIRRARSESGLSEFVLDDFVRLLYFYTKADYFNELLLKSCLKELSERYLSERSLFSIHLNDLMTLVYSFTYFSNRTDDYKGFLSCLVNELSNRIERWTKAPAQSLFQIFLTHLAFQYEVPHLGIQYKPDVIARLEGADEEYIASVRPSFLLFKDKIHEELKKLFPAVEILTYRYVVAGVVDFLIPSLKIAIVVDTVPYSGLTLSVNSMMNRYGERINEKALQAEGYRWIKTSSTEWEELKQNPPHVASTHRTEEVFVSQLTRVHTELKKEVKKKGNNLARRLMVDLKHCERSHDALFQLWQAHRDSFDSMHYTLLWRRIEQSTEKRKDGYRALEYLNHPLVFDLLQATQDCLPDCTPENLRSILSSLANLGVFRREIWDAASDLLTGEESKNDFAQFDAQTLVMALGDWITSRMDPTKILEGIAREVCLRYDAKGALSEFTLDDLVRLVFFYTKADFYKKTMMGIIAEELSLRFSTDKTLYLVTSDQLITLIYAFSYFSNKTSSYKGLLECLVKEVSERFCQPGSNVEKKIFELFQTRLAFQYEVPHLRIQYSQKVLDVLARGERKQLKSDAAGDNPDKQKVYDTLYKIFSNEEIVTQSSSETGYADFLLPSRKIAVINDARSPHYALLSTTAMYTRYASRITEKAVTALGYRCIFTSSKEWLRLEDEAWGC